jgi:hypothetical protein
LAADRILGIMNGRAIRCAVIGAAILALANCATTVTTVRTVTPEEYGAQSWIGHSVGEVTQAWGENGRAEPDGSGGRVLIYRKLKRDDPTPQAARTDSSIGTTDLLGGPSGGPLDSHVSVDDLAKFWIDASGKVYRYWFSDEVYKKHLDAPNAKPLETYGKKAS